MSNVLTHRFVSPKLDGSDATQVQPSAWNDGHRFSGGTDGQVLTRDTTDASWGAKWTPRQDEMTVVRVDLAAPATFHDWDPGIVGSTFIFLLPTAGAVNVTGFKPAAAPYPGQIIRVTLIAAAPNNLILHHEDAGSNAGYRIATRPTDPVTISGVWAYAEFTWAPIGGVGRWALGGWGNGQ